MLCRAVWAGPWLVLAFMYWVVVQRSTTAMLILALILGEALLVPTGKVRQSKPLPGRCPCRCMSSESQLHMMRINRILCFWGVVCA